MSKAHRAKARIKAETLCRSAEPATFEWRDAEKRVLSMTFSSEFAVRRGWGVEILDHSPGAADLSRFQAGAAVRDGHTGDQIGVVEEASIGADRRGRCAIRFGTGVRAEEIRRDAADGVRRNVSVAYQIQRMKLEGTDADGVDTYRALAWQPIHVAFVADPADPSVGVGRSDSGEAPDIAIDNSETEENTRMEADPKAVTPAAAPAPVVDVKAVARDVAEIFSIGQRHGLLDEAQKHIAEGGTLDGFRALALAKLASGMRQVDPVKPMELKPSEAKRYSLVRAFHQIATRGKLDGFEAEISQETARRVGKEPEGFFVPMDMKARDLEAGTASEGGYTIGTDVLGSSLIELLRNRMVVVQAGAQVLGGLRGNCAIPSQSGGATAYWTDEEAETTASAQAFGQVALTPHKLGAITKYTKQLLAQSSIDIEAFVREDIARVLAIAKDYAALAGTGGSGEPSGILTQCTAGAITFGGAATWADMVNFESTLAASNADVGSISFVVDAATRGKWKQIEQASTTGLWLWAPDNKVNGYRTLVSQQLVATHKVVFGNFADLILADWAGLDVVVDPYYYAATNQVRIVMHMHTDVGIRHTASFVCSADSGAQ